YRSTTRLMGVTLDASEARADVLWAASPVEPVDQLPRVPRGVTLHVVVEVDEGVPAVGGPRGDPLGPAVQRGVGVAAGVELLVTVQAHVEDRADGLLEPRPLLCGVGQDEGHLRLLELRECGVAREPVVARFEGVPQRSF